MSEKNGQSARQPSRTAQGVATLRAAHLLLDARPSLLDDPVSLKLLAPEARNAILQHPERFQTPAARAVRSHVLLRSRYAEDQLHWAYQRGVRQLVVLGAGLDTFTYRQPSWAQGLHIFEVDQPASQQLKREQLAAANIPLPPNLTFVPLDFETTRLKDGLANSGFDPGQPAFVSWLGVLVYLSGSAVDAVFGWLASLAPGSQMVFTFSQPPSGPSPLAERADALGEPWLTHLTPQVLEEQLGKLDIKLDLLTPEGAERLYLRDRPDRLPTPKRSSIGLITVPG